MKSCEGALGATEAVVWRCGSCRKLNLAGRASSAATTTRGVQLRIR